MPIYIYLKLTFARPNAFNPRVRKLGTDKISTPPKPSTTTTATTAFAGFGGATLGASGARLSGGSGGSSGGSGNSGGTGDCHKRSPDFCAKGNINQSIKGDE